MEIRKIPIEQLNPAAYNPRKDLLPGDPEYEKLKRSMQEFGYVEPIVWNKRTCYMMEIDPNYCDVIIRRWENLTGQKAVLAE